MFEETLFKILGVITAVATLFHQIVTRDRARAAEIAKCVKKEELKEEFKEHSAKLNSIESRVDEIYKMLANGRR